VLVGCVLPKFKKQTIERAEQAVLFLKKGILRKGGPSRIKEGALHGEAEHICARGHGRRVHRHIFMCTGTRSVFDFESDTSRCKLGLEKIRLRHSLFL
jgi:hypothetical protein